MNKHLHQFLIFLLVWSALLWGSFLFWEGTLDQGMKGSQNEFIVQAASHLIIWFTGLVVVALLMKDRERSDKKLKENDSRFRSVFDHSPIPCSLLLKDEFIDFNQAALKLLGYSSKSQIVGLPECISPQYQPCGKRSSSLFNDEVDHLDTDALCRFDWEFVHNDGYSLSLEISLSKVRYQEQDMIYCVWCDVSQKREAERKLKLAASVFSYAGEGIALTDAKANIIDVNDSFCKITGYDRPEIIGKNPRFLQSGKQPVTFYQDLWRSLNEEGSWSGEICNKRKNGELFFEKLTISAIKDDNQIVTNFVALFSDITHIKEYQDKLERIAHYDSLTNLANKALLTSILSREIEKCKAVDTLVIVAVFNLDGFKKINDKYTYDIADLVLKNSAKNIQKKLTKDDHLARIGGDEFAVLLSNIPDLVSFLPRIEQISEQISTPMVVEDVVFSITASVGITIYPLDKEGPDQLIRHATQAMYRAKISGKNRCDIFDVNENTLIISQRRSIERIKDALERDEFTLYYQPKVNMKSGEIIGFEALIRWKHPELGVLPPSEFLPLIENHPISIKLGIWVMNEALSQIKTWQDKHIYIPVSVNVGAMQLEQNFVLMLSDLLGKHTGVDPKYLELEILETSALEEIAEVSSIMHECCKIGVSFALDDFGTGYSSLTYLKKLPVDLLKIDRSFVKAMLDNQEDHAIVAGVIGLAEAFKLHVIAEGVETIEHGTQLLAMGCLLGQGYAIAKPMPAADVAKWIVAWRPDEQWLISGNILRVSNS